MRRMFLFLGLLSCAPLAFAPAQPEFPPRPRLVDVTGCARFSVEEFDKLLFELKAERERLEAEGGGGKRPLRRTPPTASQPSAEAKQLAAQLRQALQKLRQDRDDHAPAPHGLDAEVEHAPAPKSHKVDAHEAKNSHDEKPHSAPPSPLDPLGLAHSLMRTGQYEEAWTAFDKVELTGKRTTERAPLLYLKATCKIHLGKMDEAISLLRDVANIKGDEPLAANAAWRLESIRWQREVRDKLESYRQRRAALEKRL